MPEGASPARDLALIGAGAWGLNLARCFDQLGALGFLVASESDETERARLRALHPGVEVGQSVAAVLDSPRVTMVAIAAPPSAHFELAKAALEAGKHVYVEKPLCLRLEHAETLVKLAEDVGKTLMVGHLLRYHPCITKLRQLVAGGVLGKLLTINSNRLNLGTFRSENSALWSFAPHDVSVILALLDDRLPHMVRCMGGAYLNPELADSTLTVMRFPGNVLAQVHVSWLNPFKEQRLTIVGTQAMAVFDDTKAWPEKLTLHRNYLSWNQDRPPTPHKQAGELVQVEQREPLSLQCEHFLDACRRGLRPLTDGAEGVRVLSVLDMAERSLALDGEAVRGAASGEPVYYAHPTATVDAGAVVGQGTKIWHYSHVMSGARIGERCSLGQNVNVAGGAVLGSGVKVQNNVSIYAGVQLEDDVFLGPSCVLTNVSNPRAELDRRAHFEQTLLRRGASVGANATIVPGVVLGRHCFIAAGAVVTKDVADYALMLGNPARQVGYMSRHGRRLSEGPDGLMVCPEQGLRYREIEPGIVRCLDLDEDAPLSSACSSTT